MVVADDDQPHALGVQVEEPEARIELHERLVDDLLIDVAHPTSPCHTGRASMTERAQRVRSSLNLTMDAPPPRARDQENGREERGESGKAPDLGPGPVTPSPVDGDPPP